MITDAFDPDGQPPAFGGIEDALDALRRGRLVVVVDDQDREDEGDLLGAAELVDDAQMGFLIRHSSGIVCVAVDAATAARLRLPQMVADNRESHRTAFTVTVDAANGIGTGISAADRAATVRLLADPAAGPDDLSRPGHVFPLLARTGGVLRRAGHTEAGVDLMRLAGLRPAAVLSELVDDHGNPMRRASLLRFAHAHGLVAVSVHQLARYRRTREQLTAPAGTAAMPTRWGTFSVQVFRSRIDGLEHLALTLGRWRTDEEVLVRVHSECLTGDVLGSLRCDCGAQLRASLRRIAEAGHGVLVYLRGHEGRGIGLTGKLRAYRLQDQGLDTVDANTALGLPVDAREFDTAADILQQLGVRRVALLTNNPDKVSTLRAHALRVDRRALPPAANAHNHRYLQAKRHRLGHLLEHDAGADRDPQRLFPVA